MALRTHRPARGRGPAALLLAVLCCAALACAGCRLVFSFDGDGSCAEDADCAEGRLCLQERCARPRTYAFLFAHTEDHINTDASTERLERFLPAVDALAAAYPDAGVHLTVMPMGAEARAWAESAPDAVALLQGYLARDAFSLGYHGAHEPTYENNPLALLDADAGWEATVDAATDFLTMGKDPVYGGVDPSQRGGLALVEETWDQAAAVSGVGGDQAQTHAVFGATQDTPALLFGFPDHGPAAEDAAYAEAVQALLARMAPEARTPLGLFWMDGALRLNDQGVSEGEVVPALLQDQDAFAAGLGALEAERVRVLGVVAASKYLYARQSPTEYAYDNPESPELPDSLLYADEERETRYANSLANLERLAAALQDADAARFASPSELAAAFTAWRAGQDVPLATVTALARDFLDRAGETPPDYAAGPDLYATLAETWGLVLGAVAAYHADGLLPQSVPLRRACGPVEDAPALDAATDLDRLALQAAAADLAPQGGGWQAVPADMIPAQATVDGATLNAAELLAACCSLLLDLADNQYPATVRAAPLALLPETHALLQDIAAAAPDSLPLRFPGTAWSLKPARHI